MRTTSIWLTGSCLLTGSRSLTGRQSLTGSLRLTYRFGLATRWCWIFADLTLAGFSLMIGLGIFTFYGQINLWNFNLREVKKAFEGQKLLALELEKERFESEIEELKKAKVVVESKASELESKFKGIGEEAKAELSVQESELNALKKKVEELDVAVDNGRSELDSEKLSLQEWTHRMRDMLEARKRGYLACRDKDFKNAIECYIPVLYFEATKFLSRRMRSLA